MAMIVCKKCGNQVSSDAAFCRFCGAPVEPAEPPKAPEGQPAAQEAPKAAPQEAPKAAPQAAPQQPKTPPVNPGYVPPVNPGYVPPVNPGYAPPVYPQQPMPVNEFSGKTGKGMGWIVFMRVILWIIFAGMVIAGLVAGVNVFDYDELMGIVYILGGILSAFIVVAGGMIALNNATNLRSIAMNTAKTVELLQHIKRK